MKPRRVVVTGLGALTPIGNTLSEYWEGIYLILMGKRFNEDFFEG